MTACNGARARNSHRQLLVMDMTQVHLLMYGYSNGSHRKIKMIDQSKLEVWLGLFHLKVWGGGGTEGFLKGGRGRILN